MISKTSPQSRTVTWTLWLCLGLAGGAIICWILFLAPPLAPRGGIVQLAGMDESGEMADTAWDVCVTEEGTSRQLTDIGDGRYSGLTYDGQTFYATCTLDADIGDALLQIVTPWPTALFLDDVLLYADTELDAQTGDLVLPAPESMRLEPLLVSLPPDYTGRQLTVAQSQYYGMDDSPLEAYIPLTTLLSVVRYNSERLAEGADVFYPGITLFVLGILMLIMAAVSAYNKTPIQAPVLLSAACLLWTICQYVGSTPLQLLEYYEPMPDVSLFFFGATTCLVLFFAGFMQGRMRMALSVLAVLPVIADVIVILVQGQATPVAELPDTLQLTALAAAIVFAFFQAGRKAFFAVFIRLLGAVLAVFAAYVIWQAAAGAAWFQSFTASLRSSARVGTLLQALLIVAGFGSLVWEFINRLYHRRLESALAGQQQHMAESSIRQYRRQAYETAVLQHDIRRHLGVVGLYLKEDQVPEALKYLDQIGLQLEDVPKTVATENTAADLILNSKLGEMQDLGIRADILAEEIPAELPIAEAELGSLLANTLDNAIRAAEASAEKTIAVRIYSRNGFLCYSCRNTVPVDEKPADQPSPGHGYGLGIIRQIVERHDGIVKVEQKDGWFSVTCVLPLVSPGPEKK